MPDALPEGYIEEPINAGGEALPAGYREELISGPVAGGPGVPAAFQKPIPLAARIAENVAIPLVVQGGATIGGGFLGGPAGAIAGAGAGSVANDAIDAELNHLLFGRPDPHWAAQGSIPGFQHPYGAMEESAVTGAAAQRLAPAVGSALGAITGTSGAADAARAAMEEQGQANLAARAEGYQGAVENRMKALADAQQNAAKAAGVQAESPTAPPSGPGIAGAVQDYQDQLAEKTQTAADAAKAEVAPAEAARQRTALVGKAPAETQAGEAADEEQFSGRLADTKRAFFDPFARIREARQAPYNELLGPIKDNPVGPEVEKRLREFAQGLTATPGQRINSANLKNVLTRFEEAGDDADLVALQEKQAAAGKRRYEPTAAESAAVLRAAYGEPVEGRGAVLTFGELSQLKNRAGMVLSTSKDPTERSIAHQIWNTADEELNSAVDVPQNVRDSYATYKSNFPIALSQKIAKARTPAEVGEAIFSGSPQVGLQIVKNAKPEELASLRDAFADYVNSKDLSLAQVGVKTNPQVLKGLFGDTAYASSKAWIETEPKAIKLQTLLGSSPEVKQEFEAALNQRMQQIRVSAAAKLRKAGLDAAYSLGPRGKAIANRLYIAGTPDQIEAAAKELSSLTPQDVVQDLAAKSVDPKEVVSDLASRQTTPRQAAINSLSKLKQAETERRLKQMTKFRAAWYGSAIFGGAIGGRISSWAGTMGAIDLATAASLGMRNLTRRVLANPRSAELFWQAINSKKMTTAGSLLADSFAALAANRGKKAMNIPAQISGEEQQQP